MENPLDDKNRMEQALTKTLRGLLEKARNEETKEYTESLYPDNGPLNEF